MNKENMNFVVNSVQTNNVPNNSNITDDMTIKNIMSDCRIGRLILCTEYINRSILMEAYILHTKSIDVT